MTQINAMATLWLWCACKQNQENKLCPESYFIHFKSKHLAHDWLMCHNRKHQLQTDWFQFWCLPKHQGAGFSTRQQVALLSYIDLFLSSLVLLVLVVTVKGLLLSKRWACWDESSLSQSAFGRFEAGRFVFTYVSAVPLYPRRVVLLQKTGSVAVHPPHGQRVNVGETSCDLARNTNRVSWDGGLALVPAARWGIFFKWYCWPFFSSCFLHVYNLAKVS